MLTAKQAHGRVRIAIENGLLVRPAQCEVCGVTIEQIERTHKDVWGYLASLAGEPYRPLSFPLIVAHHWKGYAHPLDVWWVCQSCNRRLHGRHDGTVTAPADARSIMYTLPPVDHK